MTPSATAFLIWLWLKEKSRAAAIIAAGTLTHWTMAAFIGRVSMFYYFQTAVPFFAMATALLLARVWRKGKWGQAVVVLYLAIVAALFVYWHPLLTGLPISSAYFCHHMWFRSWI